MNPLTAAEQDVAEACFPYCRSVARAYARKFPRLRDEIESEAGLIAMAVAREFDPSRGPSLKAHAVAYARKAVRQVHRDLGPRGYRRSREVRPEIGDLNDAIPCRSAPAAEAIDQADAFERRLATLPELHAELCRLTFRDGLTRAEAAERIGVGRIRAGRMLEAAGDILRTHARQPK